MTWTGARLPRRRFAAGGGAGALLLTCCLVCGCAGPAAAPAASLPRADLAILMMSGPATAMEADLANAVEGLIQRCMRAERLVYYAELQRAGPGFGPARLPEFPAYTSLAQRRADGYGLYADTVAAARTRGPPGGASGRSPAEREVAYVGSLRRRPGQLPHRGTGARR